MPVNSWTGGAGDNNWQTAGNWSLAAAPVTGDDVIVAPSTPTVITGGMSNGSVDLESLTITGPVQIGTASTSLTIAVSNSSTSKLICASSGPFVNITAGTNGIDRAQIVATGGGVFRCSGGTYLIVETGDSTQVEIEAGATVTTLKMAGGGCSAAAGTAFTTVTIAKGALTSYRSIATARVSGQGSRLTMKTAAAISTVLTVTGGATYDHQSSGTIASVVVEADSFAICPLAPRAFTTTNAEVWGSGQLFAKAPVVITYTNPKSFVGTATN